MADPVTPPERWLPVPGYEHYEVSDLGRFRKLIKGHDSGNGYPTVTLGRRRRFIHHLVLEVFVGPCPPGQEALHGPAGKADASLANLRWGTRSENIRDRIRDGGGNRGERHPHAKLTWAAVEEIRIRVANGESQSGVARCFDVSNQTVNLLVNGKTWRFR